MKIHRLLCLCAAVALPPPALAEIPVDGEWLGKLQSVLDFCAQRNPPAAMRYRTLAKQMLQNATAQEVTEARRMSGYREAYEANRAALGELPKQDVIGTCNNLLEANGQTDAQPVERARPDESSPQHHAS